MSDLLPEKMLGLKADSPHELAEYAGDILSREAGITHNHGIQFRNSGDIRVYEDSADMKAVVLVPLPFLHLADAETDELAEALSMLFPMGRVEVEIAPPPQQVHDTPTHDDRPI